MTTYSCIWGCNVKDHICFVWLCYSCYICSNTLAHVPNSTANFQKHIWKCSSSHLSASIKHYISTGYRIMFLAYMDLNCWSTCNFRHLSDGSPPSSDVFIRLGSNCFAAAQEMEAPCDPSAVWKVWRQCEVWVIRVCLKVGYPWLSMAIPSLMICSSFSISVVQQIVWGVLRFWRIWIFVCASFLGWFGWLLFHVTSDLWILVEIQSSSCVGIVSSWHCFWLFPLLLPASRMVLISPATVRWFVSWRTWFERRE